MTEVALSDRNTLCDSIFTQNCEQRQVTHFQYLSWPDYGVPTSAVTLIDFLGTVKRQQREAVKAAQSRWNLREGPPMVVHCSAGIGRTGVGESLHLHTLHRTLCFGQQVA